MKVENQKPKAERTRDGGKGETWERVGAARLDPWVWACVCLWWVAPSLGGPMVDETTEAFLRHVETSSGYDAKVKAFVAKAWSERGADDAPEEFMIEALALLSPRFRDGLDAYDDEDYGKTFEIMDPLARGNDPYVGANASVFAIKSLVERARYEEAEARVGEFVEDPTAVDLHTHSAAEIAFLDGFLKLQNLHYDEARRALQSMLNVHPGAADRLRVTARQMLAELQRREPERLGDVADLMGYAGRRLEHEYTDESVQAKQKRAIELLDQLIEEAEKNEQSGGGGGGSGGSGQQSPQSPMQDSQLPGGGASQSESLRNARRVKPGEEWGSMPPAEREKVLQSLRDSFPSRYRQLVEQYYQELAKQP